MEGPDSTDIFLYLLLLAALALGWWLGRRSRLNIPFSGHHPKRSPARDYFIGLNYLLNDEPDDAIDVFTDFLEVNSGTLETYIALGKLLRRRGKVDRSIAIYQELLGKNGFTDAEMNEIKINLVQSYIAAGLFDRAEHILEELRQKKGNIKVKALVHSMHIAQQEKDWPKGVKALVELIRECAPDQRHRYQFLASHFYCEMAEQEMDNEHLSQARDTLKLAANMDKSNPRVSILRGKLEARSGNYSDAIKQYLRVKKQDTEFMPEVFDALVDCYRKAGKEKGLRKFIESCMEEDNHTSVLIGLAEYLRENEGIDVARRFLINRLELKSSLRLLQSAMALELDESRKENPEVQLFNKVLSANTDRQAHYQCGNCGFELKTLHWQCPGCAEWGTVRHVKGLPGE